MVQPVVLEEHSENESQFEILVPSAKIAPGILMFWLRLLPSFVSWTHGRSVSLEFFERAPFVFVLFLAEPLTFEILMPKKRLSLSN